MKLWCVENRMDGMQSSSTRSGYKEAYVVAATKPEAIGQAIATHGWKDFALEANEIDLTKVTEPCHLASNLEE